MGKSILVLGITGSFASGKTTVASMFKRLGAHSIDADRIYHRLIWPGGSVYKRIVSTFGHQILKKNKQIDRKKLAKKVFANKGNLKKLCQITHPAIIKRMKSELSRLKRTKIEAIVVIDAPLLKEAGLINMVDKVVVVKLSRKNQIRRCKHKRGLSRQKTLQRIKSQRSLAEKIRLADFVIDNNGTLAETRKQVKNIWEERKWR